MESVLAQIAQQQQTRSDLRNTFASLNDRAGKLDKDIVKLAAENAVIEEETKRVINEVQQTNDKLTKANAELHIETQCRTSLSLTMTSIENQIKELETKRSCQNVEMENAIQRTASRRDLIATFSGK